MNTIKKSEENEQKWMNAEGGAAALWGVQKIKGEKEGKRRAWAWVEFGFGLETGRVERGYIRVLRPIFFHFSKFFSLFPSQTLGSLSSLSSLTHLLRRVFRREASGRRRLVATAAPPLQPPFFFKFFFVLSYVFYPYDSTFKLGISEKSNHGPRSKVKKSRKYTAFPSCFGSDVLPF